MADPKKALSPEDRRMHLMLALLALAVMAGLAGLALLGALVVLRIRSRRLEAALAEAATVSHRLRARGQPVGERPVRRMPGLFRGG